MSVGSIPRGWALKIRQHLDSTERAPDEVRREEGRRKVRVHTHERGRTMGTIREEGGCDQESKRQGLEAQRAWVDMQKQMNLAVPGTSPILRH